jgi:hypothetical protein
MARLALGVVAAAVFAMAGAWTQGGAQVNAVGVPKSPRFMALDVVVDAGAEGLAAYQVEIKDAAGFAKIVGIEGGEGLYKSAPYYDPAAMQKEHVIIGALSTSAADGLPRGATRVARVHVMVEGGEPKWEAVLMTAGATGGKKIEGVVRVRGAE